MLLTVRRGHMSPSSPFFQLRRVYISGRVSDNIFYEQDVVEKGKNVESTSHISTFNSQEPQGTDWDFSDLYNVH